MSRCGGGSFGPSANPSNLNDNGNRAMVPLDRRSQAVQRHTSPRFGFNNPPIQGHGGQDAIVSKARDDVHHVLKLEVNENISVFSIDETVDIIISKATRQELIRLSSFTDQLKDWRVEDNEEEYDYTYDDFLDLANQILQKDDTPGSREGHQGPTYRNGGGRIEGRRGLTASDGPRRMLGSTRRALFQGSRRGESFGSNDSVNRVGVRGGLLDAGPGDVASNGRGGVRYSDHNEGLPRRNGGRNHSGYRGGSSRADNDRYEGHQVRYSYNVEKYHANY